MAKLIKQAIVYRAELPDADQLEKHLAELPYVEISEAELSRASFVTNETTNELISTFVGGYSFTLRLDEKILPNASVKAVAKKRIAKFISECGIERIKKSDKDAITDAVRLELAKTALVKTTIVNAFYARKTHTLIVATGSKSMANILVGRLVQVVGSVKTSTIHISNIKNGLTTRLRNHLDCDADAFEGENFILGGAVKLVRAGGENVTYALDDLDKSSTGIVDLIDKGFTVDRLGLEHSDVEFNLTSNFHFKGIAFGEELDEQEDDADVVHAWRADAAMQAGQLDKVITALCDLLGYKPDEDEKAE